jgi:poly(A)-specific ribonuclease
MEVTRDNFATSLALLKEAVAKADVIAIDTELSGLNDFGDRSDMLDTLDDRFLKLKSAAERFLVLQFGVSTFEWVEKANGANQNNGYYVAKPFNFYVFPSKTVPSTDSEAVATLSSVLRDTVFSSQSSSLDFLVANNFDFNKCFYKGITYLSPAEEDIARAKAQVRSASFIAENDIVIDDSNRTFVTQFLNDIKEWLQNGKDPRFLVKCASPYHRRLIHQEVRKEFNGFLSSQSKADKTGVDVKKLTEEERKSQSAPGKEALDGTLQAIEQAVGFRRVIQVLAESKKPLIVHNGMLDLIHVTTKFCKGGAACTNAAQWKQVVQESFPFVFDTKVFGSVNPALAMLNSSTVLGDLMKQVSEVPFVSPRIGKTTFWERLIYGVFHPLFKGYEADEAFHDAGYDAFATGAVFLRMVGYTSLMRESKSNKPNLLRSIRLPHLEDELLSSVVNKLFVMRSEIPFLNLSGQDGMYLSQSNF